jgi:hypothetical protein
MTDLPVEDNPTFDFISDANFRTSLVSDYRELMRSMETGSWKSVHVLAGSVVEAILTDHLIATDYQKRTKKDPLQMDLANVIAACKDEKVITDRTADLSSVVRSYRNLIHPGRMIRLNEKVDKKSALIAKALVDVVADEVAIAKTGTYGFTAEQIINKIEKDSSALSVLSHFLKETNDRERERLAKEVIPQRYFSAQEFGFESTSGADYQDCFRTTFHTLSDESKTKVAKRFIKILKEEHGTYVLEYETMFFRASDMKYLDPSEAALAKAHMLSRLDKEQTLGVLGVLEDLGGFLTVGEISRVVDAYIKMIIFGKESRLRTRARTLLVFLGYETEGVIRQKVDKRVDDWINHFEEKEMNEHKTTLEELKTELSEMPF